MNERHAVIVGLDGMPLRIFEKLFEYSAMPFTKHLWGKMLTAELEVDLPFTLASWTTISTGVNPGKHGIFDFLRPLSNGEPRLVTREDLERPTINEIVALNKLESVTINVPMTFPPVIKSRNTVISDWTYPKKDAWPPKEREIVRKYLLQGPPIKYFTIDGYIEALLEGLEHRIDLIEHYYTKRNWTLFYTVIPEPDWIFHKLYGEILRGSKRATIALKIFHKIDKTIKMIYENMPEKTMLILCSDHGFMEANIALNGNILLKKLGLLKSAENLNLKSKIALTLAKILPSKIKHRLKYSSAVIIAHKIGMAEPFKAGKIPIDYSNSKAYMTISYNIYINPKVSQNERSQIRNYVINELRKYEHIIQTLQLGDKYFKGPCVNKAPDIIVIPREGCNITTRLGYKEILEKGKWYIHSTKGFIAIKIDEDNNVIRSNVTIIRNYDITPTVLGYLHLPLDLDMDGTVLTVDKAFKPKYHWYSKYYKLLKRLRKSL